MNKVLSINVDGVVVISVGDMFKNYSGSLIYTVAEMTNKMARLDILTRSEDHKYLLESDVCDVWMKLERLAEYDYVGTDKGVYAIAHEVYQ